jgi:hypothetical protein
MLHNQACDGADFSAQDTNAQWQKRLVIIFSKECCSNATRRRKHPLLMSSSRRQVGPTGL